MTVLGWMVVILLPIALAFGLGFWAATTSVTGVLGKLEDQGLLVITNDALRAKAHR